MEEELERLKEIHSTLSKSLEKAEHEASYWKERYLSRKEKEGEAVPSNSEHNA